MQKLAAIPMLLLQLVAGTVLLTKATYRKIKAKVTGKPYDSGMDME